MLRSRLDRAFGRYCRTGDPRALARVFDGTANELFRLAWHLVGDRHAAEDLVQTTFLVAIQDARSFDGERGVMPWLCGILANRALHHRRQVRGRVEVDVAAAMARAAGGVDPVGIAAAKETNEVVAAAVRSLPDPYRQVLLLHLLHELAPKEIAEALARPDATVRVQLHRGLDLLRKALPVGIAGVALACAPAPMGLAAVRAVVMAKAGEAVAVTVGAGALIAVGGLLAMKKILFACGAVALFLLCAWPLLPPREMAAPVTGNAAAPVAASAQRDLADGANDSVPQVERTEVVVPSPDAMAMLDVDVRWSDGTPAAEVTVRCQPVRTGGELLLRAARSDDQGAAHFAAVASGKVRVSGDRGGEVELEIAAGGAARTELVLPRGFDVHGVVVDPEGRSVAGAEVWLSAARNSDESEVVAHSAPDGTFTVRSSQAIRALTATAPGLVCVRVAWVEDGKANQEVTLQLRPALGAISGSVLDPAGRPVANARVLVGGAMGNAGLGTNGTLIGQVIGADLWPSRFVRTDVDGRFTVASLPPLRWPVWVGAPGFAPARIDVDVEDGASAPVIVRLQRGARVTGRVTSTDGPVVSGAEVVGFYEWPGTPSEISLGHPMGAPSWAYVSTSSRSDGSFDLQSVAAVKLHLNAWKTSSGGSSDFELMLADGQSAVWNPVLVKKTFLHGVLVDSDGHPLPGWWVRCEVGEKNAITTANREGRFLHDLQGKVPHRFSVRPGEPQVGRWHFVCEVIPDGEARIVVPRELMPRSRLVGRVVGPDGNPVAGLEITASLMGSADVALCTCTTQADGSFRTGLLCDGRFRMSAYGKNWGSHAMGEWDLPVAGEVDIGIWRVPEPGRLLVRVVDARGQRLAGVWLRVREVGRQDGGYYEEGKVSALRAGRYRVSTRNDTPMVVREIDVGPGATMDLELVLPETVRFRLRIPRMMESLWEVWRDSNGALLRDDDIDFGEQTVDRALPAGRYTLEGRDKDGHTATTTVDLRATDPPMIIDLPIPAAK